MVVHPKEYALTPAATFQSRRNHLRNRVGDATVLLYSGRERFLNIESNVLPFRASSYFIFLFGPCDADVVGLISPTETLLFVPDRDATTLLWEGEGESFKSIQERSGVDRVLEMHQLETCLKTHPGSKVLTIDTIDGAADKLSSLSGGEVVSSSEDDSLLRCLAGLRLVHDAYGLSQLRLAAERTTTALRVGMVNTRGGVTDLHLKNLMEAHCLSLGARQSFPAIVTSKSEALHQVCHGEILRDGDLLLVDIGAEVPSGYAGDCTRCWPVSGAFTSEQAAIYDIVKQAHDCAIDALEIGRWFIDVHEVACRSICEGLREIGVLIGSVEELMNAGVHTLFFPHGIGHLVGLDVHDMEDLGDLIQYEAPAVRSNTFGYNNLRLNRRLCPGMVLTIEPGVYFIPALLDDPTRSARYASLIDQKQLSRFRSVRGIRLEDTVALHPNGVEVLTSGIPLERPLIEQILLQKRHGVTAA